MCTFFFRLTREIKGYQSRIYFGFGFIIFSWLVVELNLLLSCRPFSHMWQINPNPGPFCMPATSPALIWTYLSFNVATDLYLIAIPMPMLWKAAMPLAQRLSLMALFSCGLFVTACAILRVVLLVSDPVHGAQLAGSWAVRETFVAVITTNLPICFPMIKRFVNPFVNFVSSQISSVKRSNAESPFPTTLDTWRSKTQRDSQPLSSNPANDSETRMFALEEIQAQAARIQREEDKGESTRSRTNTESSIEEDGIHKAVQIEVHDVREFGVPRGTVHTSK